jgi:hypothetical protein
MKVLRTHKVMGLTWGIFTIISTTQINKIFGLGCLTITLKNMEQIINEHKFALMHKNVQQLNNLNIILF